MQPDRFFDQVFPALAKEHAALFGALRGTLAFIVKGRGWTVQLGDHAQPVRRDADPSADLVLSFTPAAFDAFLRGTLDVPAALANHAIAHDGDLAVLPRFGQLLKKPDSWLSVRT